MTKIICRLLSLEFQNVIMKNFITLLASIYFMLFLASCSTYSKSSTRMADSRRVVRMADGENHRETGQSVRGCSYDTDSYMDDLSDKYDVSNRLIIYNASLVLTVKKLDFLRPQLNRLANFHGGYIDNYSDSRVVMKVRSDRLNAVLVSLQEYGEVSEQRVKSQDITDSYRDLEIALENSEKARNRYLELLIQATTVADMLAIERELERVLGQIERHKTQLNNFDNKLQFSEVVISVREKVKPGIIGYLGIGVYKSVKWLFVR